MYSNVDIDKYGELKSRNVAGHNLRQIPSDNVNPKKSHLNVFFAGSANMNYDAVKSQMLSKFKLRKNGVRTVNLSFQASAEGLKTKKQIDAWREATFKFIDEKFGKENLIYCVCHMDEKTPHIQCEVLPVHNGKLNASHFFDGRKKCGDFCTAYNDAVKHLGFKRDKGKDKAKPQETSEYYRKVKESEEFDQKVDQALNSIEKKLSSRSTFGLIKTSTAMSVFQPFWDTLKRYKAQAISNREKIAEAKKIKQENEDLKLKFENLGLSHEMKFSECVELKKHIDEVLTAKAEKQAPASLHEKKEVKIQPR